MPKREGIRPPKFADKFYKLDFDSNPIPIISLFEIPQPKTIEALELDICGLDLKSQTLRSCDLAVLPRVRAELPLICSIFNWSEVVQWEGVRLSDVLAYAGVDTDPAGYFAFHSDDGVYFETLTHSMAHDPWTLLATSLNGLPLPLEHGGPLRLVVPFLQGYKSVKWLKSIRAYKHDPSGIKRLLGQSKTGYLGQAWLEKFAIGREHSNGKDKTPI
jgi:DMSO/TMAO reductase YedYZ molybdopterin-dependent catalytic subunit